MGLPKMHRHEGSINFPPSTKDLPTEHGILLTPESVGSDQIGENSSTGTDAGQRNAENKEAEDGMGLFGMLQSEKLGNDDAEEGQC
ncbi:MAG: hypothetical protein Q9172_003320 [Xanthocarpia lactea]